MNTIFRLSSFVLMTSLIFSTYATEVYPKCEYQITAEISQKTQWYITSSTSVTRNSFTKTIYKSTNHPDPIPYSDELIDTITQSIWGAKKVWTESLALATLDINTTYANLPIRTIWGGQRIEYSVLEELLYENNNLQKAQKNFDFLLWFFDKYKLYDNATIEQTYTLETAPLQQEITFTFFPFSPNDIQINEQNTAPCVDDENTSPKYYIPKLLVTTPYFDVRNLNIEINTTKVQHIQREYYTKVYEYTTDAWENIKIPALLPYYTIHYTLSDAEKNQSQQKLHITYEEHTLESPSHHDTFKIEF